MSLTVVDADSDTTTSCQIACSEDQTCLGYQFNLSNNNCKFCTTVCTELKNANANFECRVKPSGNYKLKFFH